MKQTPTTHGRLHYFTWGPSRADRRMRLTLESARNVGFRPNVIICGSTEEKPQTLISQMSRLSDDEIVLCTDAFDVLCTEGPDTVKEKFLVTGKEILFGSESLCFHHLKAARRQFEHDAQDAPYPYLNGGMFVGLAGAVREMLRVLGEWDLADLRLQFESDPETRGWFNDQSLFGKYAALHRGRVGLDKHAQIFLNLSGHYSSLDDDLRFDSQKVFNKLTRSEPSFLHLTQVRRYYPRYLYLARQIGIKVSASNVDLELVRQHLAGDPSVKASDSGELDFVIERRLRRSPSFQMREIKEQAISGYRSARFNFGRYRRRLLSGFRQD